MSPARGRFSTISIDDNFLPSEFFHLIINVSMDGIIFRRGCKNEDQRVTVPDNF